jgi:4'-phosphopantetheinyl transferase
MHPLDEIEDLIQSFSPIEIDTLMGMKKNEKLKSFFKLWVAKESYLKATGAGLSVPLDSFSVVFNYNDLGICRLGDMSPWYIKLYAITKDLPCAICAQHTQFPKQYLQIPPEHLLTQVYHGNSRKNHNSLTHNLLRFFLQKSYV